MTRKDSVCPDDEARWAKLFDQFDEELGKRSHEFYLLLVRMTRSAPEQLAAIHKKGLYEPATMERLTFQMLHQRYQEILRLRPREEHQKMIETISWLMEASPWVYVYKQGIYAKTELEALTQ